MTDEYRISPAEPEPIDLLTELMEEHRRRLRQWRQPTSSNFSAEEFGGYLQRVAAAGTKLRSDADRAAAQTILDQWNTKFASSDTAQSNELPTRIDPYASQGNEDALKAEARRARDQIRISAMARQWSEENEDVGYLLNGRAAKNAEQFRKSDPIVGSYIAASKRYEFKRRLIQGAAGAVAGIAIAVFAILYFTTGMDLTKVRDAGTVFSQDAYVVNQSYQKCQRDLANSRDTDIVNQRALLNARTALTKASETGRQCSPDVSSTSAAALNNVNMALQVGVAIPAPSAQDAQISGTIWLGNDTTSKVRDAASKPISAKDIIAGDRITAATTLALRRDFPSSLGQLTDGIGVVPIRSVLKVLEVRQINGQYFAKIEYTALTRPLVFFQFTDADGTRARSMQAELKKRGYAVPGIEPIHRPINSSVKYDQDCLTSKQWPSIARSAQDLADAANTILRTSAYPGGPIPTKPIKNGCKVLNTLELWIAFAPGPEEPLHVPTPPSPD